MRRRIWIFYFLILLTVDLRGSEWPQFRGPLRDGAWRETGILNELPPGGPKILWRRPGGHGFAEVVVVGKRVLVFDAELVKPTATERLQCLSEKSGKVLWVFPYPAPYGEWAFEPERGAGPTATPIVDGNKVYILGGLGDVHCLDLRNGRLLWKRRLQDQFQVAELQCRPSPLIEGRHLILFTGAKPDAAVIALDKETGREVWKNLNDPVSSSSPIVVNTGGMRQLIVWSNAAITSLDPATGHVFWREEMTTSGNDSIPTPVFDGRRLLISGLMMELDEHSPTERIIWPDSRIPARRLLSNTSNPVLAGDYIYSARSSGELVCLNAKDGAQIWSKTNLSGAGFGSAINLTLNGERAFILNDRGELIVGEINPESFHEISRAQLIQPTMPLLSGPKRAWVPPAFAHRKIFVRSDEEIVCASLTRAR